MIEIDEEALICDLAETYHIYDYKQLPLSTVAVFSCGLKHDSRIKLKLSKQEVPMDTLLLAGIADRLSLLVWSKTKDAQTGKNPPVSIVANLTNEPEKEPPVTVFSSSEEFERNRKALLEDGGG